jgi:tetratricopeptide (TPR) repeat protein
MNAQPDLPAPSAQGILSERPPEHLLVYARRRALTGTLVIGGGTKSEAVVVFNKGRARKVRSQCNIYLGGLLYELGAIDAAAQNDTLAEVVRSKRPHGAVLRERGLLTQEALTQALAEQIARKIAHCVSLPRELGFSFYEGTDVLPGFGGTDWPEIDVLGPVWRGLRECIHDEPRGSLLRKVDLTTLRYVPVLSEDKVGFTSAEQAWVTALRCGQITADRAGAHVSERVRERLAYFLLITGSFSKGATSSAQALPRVPVSMPVPTAPFRAPSFQMPAVLAGAGKISVQLKAAAPAVSQVMPRVAAPSPKEEPAAHRATLLPGILPKDPAARVPLLLELADKLVTESDHQVLGVGPAASPEAVRATYFRLAREYHPDKQPHGCEAAHDACARICTRMAEAYRALTERGSTPRLPEPRPRGADHHRGLEFARQALRTAPRDPARACTMAEEALRSAPDDPELRVLSAWIKSHSPLHSDDVALKALAEELSSALEDAPHHAPGYYYRAQIYRRLGQAGAAIRDLKACADMDPQHTDAVRELRIVRMRMQEGASPGMALGIPGAKAKAGDSLTKLLAVLRKDDE